MKKIVIITSILLFVFFTSIFIYNKSVSTKKNENRINSVSSFSDIEKLNTDLFASTPDSTVITISGFKGSKRSEINEYQNLIGLSLVNRIFSLIEDKIIKDLYLKKGKFIYLKTSTEKFVMYSDFGDYSIYTIETNPLLIKDFRVIQYVYFKDDNLTKYKFKKMETVYKLEKLEKIKPQWYKVTFTRNSGRSLNF